MQVHSCIRRVKPGDRLSITKLWDEGRSDMDMAYNAGTNQGINFTFLLGQMDMVFFFVGGRASLIQYFASNANLRMFLPLSTSSLGVITDRKKYHFKKDKTLVGVCNVGLQSLYHPTPIKSFIGVEGVQPLDADGARMTTAQLASILRSIFSDKTQERQQVLGAIGEFIL